MNLLWKAGVCLIPENQMESTTHEPGDGGDEELRRVLIISQGSLLSEGVESLMTRQDDVEVVRVRSKSVANVMAEIERLRPHAIIFDDSKQFAELARFASILNVNSEIQFIVVREDSNFIQVYQQHQILITQVSDLVSLIRRMGPHPI